MEKFQRATGAVLREAGWDPEWFVDDPDEEGPYVVSRDLEDGLCHTCGEKAIAWTVVNVATATGIGVSWTSTGGEIAAQETASSLNAAWLEGHAAAARAAAQPQ